MNRIRELAIKQLEAYNRADLDAFCACYHPDVVVLDSEGRETLRGAEAFRCQYAPMFAQGEFGADVVERLSVASHCVDHERYWRTTGQDVVRGELLVRYSLRDDLIGVVQFLR